MLYQRAEMGPSMSQRALRILWVTSLLTLWPHGAWGSKWSSPPSDFCEALADDFKNGFELPSVGCAMYTSYGVDTLAGLGHERAELAQQYVYIYFKGHCAATEKQTQPEPLRCAR
jgi:hypothetical protein